MTVSGGSDSDNPWMTFTGTYYNNDVASTGKSPGHPAYGVTASGRTTTDGVTISVDPSIIPLDSIVKIRYPDGTEEIRRADDTGSAIKGYKIDIYKNASDDYLYQLGKLKIQVQIIKRG